MTISEQHANPYKLYANNACPKTRDAEKKTSFTIR